MVDCVLGRLAKVTGVSCVPHWYNKSAGIPLMDPGHYLIQVIPVLINPIHSQHLLITWLRRYITLPPYCNQWDPGLPRNVIEFEMGWLPYLKYFIRSHISTGKESLVSFI